MYSEFDKSIYSKSKVRSKMRFVRNFLLLLLALFFIAMAFTFILDTNGAIGDGMKNIRFGLFSAALVISGTAILLVMFLRSRK